MSKHSRLSPIETEGIDAIIDSVAADPRNAAHAKSILRARMDETRSVLTFPVVATAANDDEDMWDNMPV